MPVRPEPFQIDVEPLPVGLVTRTQEEGTQGFLQFENWWPAPGDFGSMEVAPGFAAVGGMSAISGTPTIRTVYQGEQSSEQKRRYFLTGDTSTWLITDPSSPSPTKIKGGLTADKQFNVVDFDDITIFFNGVDTPFKFDYSSDTSSAVSDMGLTRPDVSSMTASANDDDGNVKGVVQYWVAFVEGTDVKAMSEVGPSVDAGGGNTVSLASIPTGGGSTTARRIYRSEQDRDQPYYLDTIEDDSTTTYEDDIADLNLGEPPFKHGEPPPDETAFGIVHFNRLWIGGHSANEVWWSDLNEPESFNKWSFLNVWEKDGDEITGLARLKNGILIFKYNHLYKAIGTDPVAQIMDIVPVTSSDPNNTAIGCPSHQAIASTDKGHLFYYNTGFYMIDEACTIQYISRQIEDELRADIHTDLQEEVVCKYWPDRKAVFCSVPTSATERRTYIYWLELGRWTRYSEGFYDFATVEIGSDGNPPDRFEFWGSRYTENGDGLVMRLDNGDTSFNGDNIEAVAEFPPFFAINPHTLSQWWFMHVQHDTISSSSPQLTCTLKFENETGSGTDVAFSLDAGSFERWHRRVALGFITTNFNLTLKSTLTDSDTEFPIIHGVSVYGASLTPQSQ